jgi:hypothetical protein
MARIGREKVEGGVDQAAQLGLRQVHAEVVATR